MSTAEVLRGFVTDRLAAASREILGAVDRMVAGYEEEASGFIIESFPPDVQQLMVKKEVPTEFTSSPDPEDSESPVLKQEQEEDQVPGLEETRNPVRLFQVKSEDEEMNEPARSCDPQSPLQPDPDPEEEASDSSDTEISENDSNETRVAQSDVKIDEGDVNVRRCDSSEKPFSCPECGKTSKKKWDLKSHKVVHTGERPFSCDVCGKNFLQKAHLRLHMVDILKLHKVVHTGERPFSCDVCGKNFLQKAHLRLHMVVILWQKI
uniref:C2H2-type domain-containing protein n=1 Tax=Echeneis naucrates TaxID=173247 RepID=A0A665TN72_ECHNA